MRLLNSCKFSVGISQIERDNFSKLNYQLNYQLEFVFGIFQIDSILFIFKDVKL